MSSAEAQSDDAASIEDTPTLLERKLHGTWSGPPCGGDWTFAADGTFAVEHYSPGGNKLTGTWKLRWDALPPTLVLTVHTSDAPERIEVGTTWQWQLVQLNNQTVACLQPAKPERRIYWQRVSKP